MQVIPRLTNAEMSIAYREVVERCMVVFFHQEEEHAKTMVDEWWTRLTSRKRAFRSGLFLHAPAIRTAGDLARSEEYPLTDDNWHIYDDLIREASLRVIALRQRKTKPRVATIAKLQQPVRRIRAAGTASPAKQIESDTPHRQQRVVA